MYTEEPAIQQANDRKSVKRFDARVIYHLGVLVKAYTRSCPSEESYARTAESGSHSRLNAKYSVRWRHS